MGGRLEPPRGSAVASRPSALLVFSPLREFSLPEPQCTSIEAGDCCARSQTCPGTFVRGCCTLTCSFKGSSPVPHAFTCSSQIPKGDKGTIPAISQHNEAKTAIVENPVAQCGSNVAQGLSIPSRAAPSTNKYCVIQHKRKMSSRRKLRTTDTVPFSECACLPAPRGDDESIPAALSLPVKGPPVTGCRVRCEPPALARAESKPKTSWDKMITASGQCEFSDPSPVGRTCFRPRDACRKPTTDKTPTGSTKRTGLPAPLQEASDLSNHCDSRSLHHDTRSNEKLALKMSSWVDTGLPASPAPAQLAVGSQGETCASPHHRCSQAQPQQTCEDQVSSQKFLNGSKRVNVCDEQGSKLPQNEAESNEKLSAVSPLNGEASCCVVGPLQITVSHGSESQTDTLPRTALLLSRETKDAGCLLFCTCVRQLPRGNAFRSCHAAQQRQSLVADWPFTSCCSPNLMKRQGDCLLGSDSDLEKHEPKRLSVHRPGPTCNAGAMKPNSKELRSSCAADCVLPGSQSFRKGQCRVAPRTPPTNLDWVGASTPAPSSSAVSSPATSMASLATAILCLSSVSGNSPALSNNLQTSTPETGTREGANSGGLCHAAVTSSAAGVTTQGSRFDNLGILKYRQHGKKGAFCGSLASSQVPRWIEQLSDKKSASQTVSSTQAHFFSPALQRLRQVQSSMPEAFQHSSTAARECPWGATVLCWQQQANSTDPSNHVNGLACSSTEVSPRFAQRTEKQLEVTAATWAAVQAPGVMTELISQPKEMRFQLRQLHGDISKEALPPTAPRSIQRGDRAPSEGKNTTEPSNADEDSAQNVQWPARAVDIHIVPSSPGGNNEARKRLTSKPASRDLTARLLNHLGRSGVFSRLRRRSANSSISRRTQPAAEKTRIPWFHAQQQHDPSARQGQSPVSSPVQNLEVHRFPMTCLGFALQHPEAFNSKSGETRKRDVVCSSQGPPQQEESGFELPFIGRKPRSTVSGVSDAEVAVSGKVENTSNLLRSTSDFEPAVSTLKPSYSLVANNTVDLPDPSGTSPFSPEPVLSPESVAEKGSAEISLSSRRKSHPWHASTSKGSTQEALDGARRAVAAARCALSTLERKRAAPCRGTWGNGRGDCSRGASRILSPSFSSKAVRKANAIDHAGHHRKAAPNTLFTCPVLKTAEVQQWHHLLERHRELERRSG